MSLTNDDLNTFQHMMESLLQRELSPIKSDIRSLKDDVAYLKDTTDTMVSSSNPPIYRGHRSSGLASGAKGICGSV